MTPQLVRSQFARFTTLSILAGAVVFAAACGSSDLGGDKLKALKTGDTRAKVAEVMGNGPLTAISEADSTRMMQGYRLQRYVTNGTTHEIIWYREQPGSIEDSLVAHLVTPVVMVSDTLVGWGWSFFNKYASANGLPNPSKDAARLDSIAKSQMQGAKTP
jgi:hypothetical protein